MLEITHSIPRHSPKPPGTFPLSHYLLNFIKNRVDIMLLLNLLRLIRVYLPKILSEHIKLMSVHFLLSKSYITFCR